MWTNFLKKVQIRTVVWKISPNWRDCLVLASSYNVIYELNNQFFFTNSLQPMTGNLFLRVLVEGG